MLLVFLTFSLHYPNHYKYYIFLIIKFNNIYNDLDTLEGTVSGVATLLQCYPVGSIYLSYNSTNPGNLFGGTWAQIQGRFLLGVSSSYTLGSTGGNSNGSLAFRIGGDYGLSSSPGEGAWHGRALVTNTYQSATPELENRSFSIMPPYIAVYIWRRTA